MYKFGKIIIQPNKKTIKDLNEFIIDGNICWIVLKNNNCIIKVKIDTKYYEQVKDYKWHLYGNGYVATSWHDETSQYNMLLHRLIIQLSGQKIPDDKEIDHKDMNKLNCLEDNLRICNRSQNNQNKGKQKNNTSDWKGVSWHKQTKKWQAKIGVNNKRIFLGLFDKPNDAAKTYNIAAVKYFGEFAVLNKI